MNERWRRQESHKTLVWRWVKEKKVDNLKIELHFLRTNHAILFYISHDVNEKGANGKLSLKKNEKHRWIKKQASWKDKSGWRFKWHFSMFVQI